MIATISIGVVLLIIVGAIIRNIIMKSRRGVSISCDCGRSECPISASCPSCSTSKESGPIQIQVPKQKVAS